MAAVRHPLLKNNPFNLSLTQTLIKPGKPGFINVLLMQQVELRLTSQLLTYLTTSMSRPLLLNAQWTLTDEISSRAKTLNLSQLARYHRVDGQPIEQTPSVPYHQHDSRILGFEDNHPVDL